MQTRTFLFSIMNDYTNQHLIFKAHLIKAQTTLDFQSLNLQSVLGLVSEEYRSPLLSNSDSPTEIRTFLLSITKDTPKCSSNMKSLIVSTLHYGSRYSRSCRRKMI